MHRTTLIAWLDDAYAMEIQLLPALCDRAVEAYSVAEARSRIDEHIDETKEHVERLRQALSSLAVPIESRSGDRVAESNRDECRAK